MSGFAADEQLTIAVYADAAGKWWWVTSRTITWRVALDTLGWSVTIPAGFETDLASIPWWGRWLINPEDPEAARSAVLHDFLLDPAQGFGPEHQQLAVSQFYEAMKFDGVALWHRLLMAAAVTLAIDVW